MQRADNLMDMPLLPGHRLYKTGYTVLLVVLASAVALLFIDWLLRAETLPVREVSFEGPFQRVTQAQLETTVMRHVRGNFMVLDLDAIKADVEALPWVYQGVVERRWPNGVHIRFSEQALVARWGDTDWLNRHGERVHLETDPPYTHMPLLHGPDMTQELVLDRYKHFSSILKPAGLEIDALVLTDRRTWEIGLVNGLELVVGKERVDYRLERFARIFPQALAAHADVIRRVDLRYTNGLAVEWTVAPPPVSLSASAPR